MAISVAVAGASGMAGGEALRLLLAHPEVEIGALTGASSVGRQIGEYHPHLEPIKNRVLVDTNVENLRGHDAIVLALPHGASGEITAALESAGDDAVMLDCGADHRLTSEAAWDHFYGTPFAGAWPYGMPELLHAGESSAAKQRQILRQARNIAVPGCNVTAVTLAMQPGVAAGVVDPTDIVSVLSVGYSGAGKAMRPNLMASVALGQAQPYAVGGVHRHIPEIEQNFLVAGAEEVSLSFTPVLVPMNRGILATVTAPLVGDPGQVRAAWEAAYGNEPLIKLEPEGTWPTTITVLGTGRASVQVTVDERAGKVVALCAVDNLGKGTASAALQSMNIALGLEETLGLPTIGVAP